MTGRVTEYKLDAGDDVARTQLASISAALQASLGEVTSGPMFVKTGDREVELPRLAAEALLEISADLSACGRIVVMEADHELTPRQASEVLGLSRAFVDRLLKDGTIPSRQLPSSSHQRVRLADVVAFQRERMRRREGVDRIIDEAVDAGLEY